MLREYVISEAMAALGIPTTRSLAVVTTGEPVYRESVRRGAILTRVAASHIRVGTFEYAARRDEPTLRALADYAIARHYPELADAPREVPGVLPRGRGPPGRAHRPVAARRVHPRGDEHRQHGDLRGDDRLRPLRVHERLRPGHGVQLDRPRRPLRLRQPARIAQWNLARFAETLLPLLDPDPEKAVAVATEVLDEFPARFERYWLAGMRKKLGLRTDEAGDAELIRSLLDWMQKSRADFTNTFRDLSSEGPPAGDRYRDPDFRAWHPGGRSGSAARAGRPPRPTPLMRAVNPAVIPRNHRVEEALSAAEDHDDLSVLHRLLEALASPYEASGRPGTVSRPARRRERLPDVLRDVGDTPKCKRTEATAACRNVPRLSHVDPNPLAGRPSMPWFDIIWNYEPGGNVDHVAQHGLTPEDVEYDGVSCDSLRNRRVTDRGTLYRRIAVMSSEIRQRIVRAATPEENERHRTIREGVERSCLS